MKIKVSGGGSVDVNGVYVENGTFSGKTRFDNGLFWIQYLSGWKIARKTDGITFYDGDTSETPDLCVWTVGDGVEPVPTVQELKKVKMTVVFLPKRKK